MSFKKRQKKSEPFHSEISLFPAARQGRIHVALVYPNRYGVGMANLGFQSVYRLLNEIDDVCCERVFLQEAAADKPGTVVSLESQRRLKDFDIVAFSISFENDYPHVLTLLDRAGIPLRSRNRGTPFPLVIAGGVACFLNPEPIAEFIDLFILGEAEDVLSQFFEVYEPGHRPGEMLRRLAQEVPGVYVPRFYETTYFEDGRISGFREREDVPTKILRRYPASLNGIDTVSSIITEGSTFGRTFLVEVGRGCPHGCRFCSAGFVYRPPRFRDTDAIDRCIRQGMAQTDRIGLVGAAVSDLPGIADLCNRYQKDAVRLSFSSLRADGLSPELLEWLRRNRVKTATIAPDAGSERMRRVINKGLTENAIFTATRELVAHGILNVKLYFMVGLPTETPSDVSEIVDLCKKIKQVFLKHSRIKGRMGAITVSLNCFVPKPLTPFQWAAMDSLENLKSKIAKIKTELRQVPNIRVNSDEPRWAYIQALLSRGDRRVSEILLAAHQNRGNWPKTFKSTRWNPDFYVHREREKDETLPWDFIDHGIGKRFLWQEYQRARAGKSSPPCPMGPCDQCGICKPSAPRQPE